jgi:hypothetical protein
MQHMSGWRTTCQFACGVTTGFETLWRSPGVNSGGNIAVAADEPRHQSAHDLTSVVSVKREVVDDLSITRDLPGDP